MALQSDPNVRARKLINERLQKVLGKGPTAEKFQGQALQIKDQAAADRMALKQAIGKAAERDAPTLEKTQIAKLKAQVAKKQRDVLKKAEKKKKGIKPIKPIENGDDLSAAQIEKLLKQLFKKGGGAAVLPLVKFARELSGAKGDFISCPMCLSQVRMAAFRKGAGPIGSGTLGEGLLGEGLLGEGHIGSGIIGGQAKRKRGRPKKAKAKKKRKPNARNIEISRLMKKQGIKMLMVALKKFKGVSLEELKAM